MNNKFKLVNLTDLGIIGARANMLWQIATTHPDKFIIGGSLAMKINGNMHRDAGDIDIIVDRRHWPTAEQFINDLHWHYITTTRGDYYHDKLKGTEFGKSKKGHSTILRHSYKRYGIKMCVFDHEMSTDGTYELYDISKHKSFHPFLIKVLNSDLVIRHKQKYVDNWAKAAPAGTETPNYIKKHIEDINAYENERKRYNKLLPENW